MARQSKIEHLISLIFTTTRLIRERTRRPERINPFSFLRLGALRYVSEKGTPSMSEVADYLCITPPSVTSLINGLVKARQLSRLFDKDDRRIVRLAITPSGIKTVHEGFDAIAKRMEKVLDKLDDKEKDELSNILEKLARVYQE